MSMFDSLLGSTGNFDEPNDTIELLEKVREVGQRSIGPACQTS